MTLGDCHANYSVMMALLGGREARGSKQVKFPACFPLYATLRV